MVQQTRTISMRRRRRAGLGAAAALAALTLLLSGCSFRTGESDGESIVSALENTSPEIVAARGTGGQSGFDKTLSVSVALKADRLDNEIVDLTVRTIADNFDTQRADYVTLSFYQARDESFGSLLEIPSSVKELGLGKAVQSGGKSLYLTREELAALR
ncbi:hypothetical protein [uncultured Microbacterium sp.]|uniref:hypothetical protein n=1 Tax=uncultured Microbacterium sp. TaxID=191216 RepID=UPI0025D02FB4|nr:hypothetical protein [uncultured Microbacterium sp.]